VTSATVAPPAGTVYPHDGDVAFAVSVATLYDLTTGAVGWPVRLTRHSSPTAYTLSLANRTPGGPILNIMNWDLSQSIFTVKESGVSSMQVGGYLDLGYQAPPPTAPPASTLRMYSHDDQLFFKVPGSEAEQHIPIGQEPGPSMRYGFWMGGG